MNKEKYEIILSALAKVLKEQEDKIILQDHIIDTLTKKVEAAEALKSSGKPQNIERR